MQVRTKEMAADFDIEDGPDGDVILIFRAGLLPRQKLCALGTLLEEVHAIRAVAEKG